MSWSGQRPISDAAALLYRADEMVDHGNIEAAWPILESLMQMLRKPEVESDVQTPMLIHNASALIREFDPNRAIQLLDRGLQLAAKFGQADSTAWLNLGMGTCLAEVNRFLEAAEYLLAYRESGYQSDDPEIFINCECVLGHCLLLMGKAEANEMLWRAYDLAKRYLPPEHTLRAKCSIALLDAVVAANDLETADHLLDEIAELPSAHEPQHYCRAMNARARRYQLSGDYAEAEASFRNALELMESNFGPSNPGTLSAMNNLGGFLLLQGKFRDAEEIVQRAQAIIAEAPGPEPMTVAMLNHLSATIANHCGDMRWYIDLTAETAEKLKLSLGPDHPFTLLAELSVVRAFRQIGLLDEALATVSKLLPRLTGRPDDHLFWSERGLVLGSLGDYRNALESLQHAFQMLRAASNGEHPESIALLGNIAQVASRLGEFSIVRDACRTAREIINQAAMSPLEQATGLSSLAFADALAGEPEFAACDLNRALTLHRQMLPVFLSRTSMHRQWAYLRKASEFLITVLAFCSRFPAGNANLAFDAVLMLKGRLVDVVRGQWKAIREDASPKGAQLIQQLNHINQQIIEQWTALDAPPVSTERLLGRREGIQTMLSELVGAGALDESRADTQAVQDALVHTGSVLVEFVHRRPVVYAEDAEYVAFVLQTDKEVRSVALQPKAAEIDDLAREFRSSFETALASERGDLARQLYDILLAPLDLPLSGTLLISPDGELNQIPFAALRDEQNQLLLERYTLSYLSCARDLITFQSGPAKAGPAALFGSPFYDLNPNPNSEGGSRRRTPFRNLPYGQKEIQAVSGLLPNSRQFLRSAATKGALLDASIPSVLHIATHGWFSDDAPSLGNAFPEEAPLLQCGLALAGANWEDNGTSGCITALEIANLDLRGCRLAVLSACETGRGTVRTGDGIYSMRRALALAGARAQIVSLWQVNDASTMHLMKRFYELLKEKKLPADALREAQESLKEISNEYRNPHYWAAFVLSGDPAPVPELFSAPAT